MQMKKDSNGKARLEILTVFSAFKHKYEENKSLLPSSVASLPLSDETRVCSVVPSPDHVLVLHN